uniref:Uncharacterized protein n=1 Tax=Cacopsylla melanoneura TaxID=428564 RepID=A0A8D9AU26_9HEMI
MSCLYRYLIDSLVLIRYPTDFPIVTFSPHFYFPYFHFQIQQMPPLPPLPQLLCHWSPFSIRNLVALPVTRKAFVLRVICVSGKVVRLGPTVIFKAFIVVLSPTHVGVYPKSESLISNPHTTPLAPPLV